MRQVNYFTNNALQTRKIGEKIAQIVIKKKLSKKAVVLSLEGNLGYGKTTFIKGLAKGLGIKEKIVSPTFIIMNRFKIYQGAFDNFYHFDFYRIEKEKEVLSLGFKKIISDPKNIVAIEWADKVKKVLPKEKIRIIFNYLKRNKRVITIDFN